MGQGHDYSVELRNQFPWIAGQSPPQGSTLSGTTNLGGWDMADWLGYQKAYEPEGLGDINKYVGQNPAQEYQDFAMAWAGQEFDARTKELDFLQQQQQMMERLLPYEETMRQQEISNAESRQAWENQIRGFLDPLTRGEGLPGIFSEIGQEPTGRFANIGQPASAEELQGYWDKFDPQYREMLTQRGLTQSGGAVDVMNQFKEQASLADIGRARGENANLYNNLTNQKMGLANLMQGMPYQGSPSANVSPQYQSNVGGALGMGSNMLQNEWERASQANQWNSAFGAMNDYNADMGTGVSSWLPQVLGIGNMFGNLMGGGSGSLQSGVLKGQQPYPTGRPV